MFLLDIKNHRVFDFFTGQPADFNETVGKPIAENMVSGIVIGDNLQWWFDYNRGVIPVSGLRNEITFPEMSEEIKENSPMSLWNVSLEIHTGRIFEHLIGPFYILYVPLAGICIMLVLISGFFVWWKVYRKQKKK